MVESRRNAMLDGKGQLYVAQTPIPELKPGEVLVKVGASLISPGTELAGIKNRRGNPSDAAPRSIGYQNAGTIIAMGEGCHGLQVGDRVACMGSGAAHSDYSVVPCNLCVKLPEGVTFEEGAFNHLGATALQAVRRGQLELGENVAVMGLGIVGQLIAQLAGIAGCRVLGVDGLKNRIDKAVETGIDKAVTLDEDQVGAMKELSRGYGMDCGFICFGGEATGALETLISMAKVAPDGHKMGRVVIVGGAKITYSFPTRLGNMDIRAASRTGPGYHDKDYEYGRDYPATLVQWTTQRNLEDVVWWIDAGKLKVRPLITHRYPLDRVAEAYELLIENPGEALGVILTP